MSKVETEVPFKLGRANLKIPHPEIIDGLDPSLSVLTFFQRLWDINGYPIDTDHHNNPRFDVPFSPEQLPLPATHNQPLTIINRRNTPTHPRDIEQARRTMRRIPTSTEVYSILVPPGVLAPFITVVEVKEERETLYNPVVTFRDQPVVPMPIKYPPPEQMTLQEAGEQRDQAYRQAIEDVLATTVAILRD